jgi:hypothetical protein
MTISVRELRQTVHDLRHADELLERCNADRSLKRFGYDWLMGYDLTDLANRFESLADAMAKEPK